MLSPEIYGMHSDNVVFTGQEKLTGLPESMECKYCSSPTHNE